MPSTWRPPYSIGDDLAEIVTYDDRMAQAARLLGLQITSPQ
jgi:hypothetical protein